MLDGAVLLAGERVWLNWINRESVDPLEEITTLRARVSELEVAQLQYAPGDGGAQYRLTPAEREVIEAAVHWVAGDTPLFVKDLCDAVAALLKERGK